MEVVIEQCIYCDGEPHDAAHDHDYDVCIYDKKTSEVLYRCAGKESDQSFLFHAAVLFAKHKGWTPYYPSGRIM